MTVEFNKWRETKKFLIYDDEINIFLYEFWKYILVGLEMAMNLPCWLPYALNPIMWLNDSFWFLDPNHEPSTLRRSFLKTVIAWTHKAFSSNNISNDKILWFFTFLHLLSIDRFLYGSFCCPNYLSLIQNSTQHRTYNIAYVSVALNVRALIQEKIKIKKSSWKIKC